MQPAEDHSVCAPGSRRGARPSTAMRRSRYFRPLALALAFMLLRIPLLPAIGLVQPALAGVDSCSPSADRILQDICLGGGGLSPTLQQFEQDTVNGWLQAHKMPLENAHLIYEHGRSDLRSVIRDLILWRIQGIIHKSLSRTFSEQVVFDWFLQRVKDKEVGLFQHAVDERERWRNDPCHWEPDPQIAEAFGLDYLGGAFCSGGLLQVFSTQPQVPAKSYFLTAGFKESYVAAITGSPGGPEVLASMFESFGAAYGVAVVAGVGTALAGLLGGIGAAQIEAALGISFALSAGALLGVVFAVVFAIVVGFVAAFELYEAQKTLDELAELDTLLANAKTRVDLAALSSTEEGAAKLTMVLVAASLPEFSSSSTLPARESDDALFYLGSPPTNLTPNLTYQDWEGDKWTATPYRGFFVQHGTENGNPATRFSPMLRVLDPHTGEKLTADLVGTNFLVTRGEPDPDDEPCMVNPMTGLSEGDLSTCRSFVVPAIELRDGDGNPETVRLAALPSFTSLPSTTFTEGKLKAFTITATGLPLPTITVADPSSLPEGFTFHTVDPGIAFLRYDGTTAIGTNEHTVLLRATNGLGTATQSFTIRTGTELKITSSADPEFVAGRFGSFLVTTSGDPTSIELRPSNCVSGLSLTDNHDGTATFSGTPPPQASPGTILGCFTCNPDLSGCSPGGFRARDDRLGAVVDQAISVHIVRPPPAQVASPSSTTFFSGVLNSFNFITAGAVTPVTISLPCTSGSAQAPSWVTLNDHGNGSATLFGLPPLGTDETFSFRVQVDTSGVVPVANCDVPNFTIHVSNAPTFLSTNRPQFGPPPMTGPTFLVTTNQESGVISLEGELPANLAFTPDPDHGRATIDGFPAVGTGGIYPLVLSMTNAAGTGFQHLRLLVKEAPTFAGAFDAAVFFVGMDNRFAVQTTGFPKSPELIGIDNPVELAMHIDLSGALPPGVSFTDTNQFDIPTGTGLFSGRPEAGSEGEYSLTLTADNGVLPAATLDFTLFVVKPGDVNRDGVVDERDLDEIRESLGKSLADPDYDPLIDTNHDGIIDQEDFDPVATACGDPDGDGACESPTEDRDGDGIPDAQDYDPTGYLYDRNTGEILSGGRVTIMPPPALMPSDGSGGFYQFFVAPPERTYTLTVQPPPGCRPVACGRLDPPPLDPMGMSVELGESEVGTTGHLASAECSANPFTLTLRLGETGDEVLLNNIPFDCTPAPAAPAPTLDVRGIVLAVLVLLGAAALGLRRRRAASDLDPIECD